MECKRRIAQKFNTHICTHTHTHAQTHTHTQYLGKTHNFWHGSALILEARAYKEGELPAKAREPPPYDGNYSEQILDPLKHVSISLSLFFSPQLLVPHPPGLPLCSQ